jgi:hypothetical protein
MVEFKTGGGIKRSGQGQGQSGIKRGIPVFFRECPGKGIKFSSHPVKAPPQTGIKYRHPEIGDQKHGYILDVIILPGTVQVYEMHGILPVFIDNIVYIEIPVNEYTYRGGVPCLQVGRFF